MIIGLGSNQGANRRSVRLFLFAGIVTLSIHLVGCGSLLNAYVNSHPTFQETVSLWPPLATNMSRVVFYFPALPNQGVLQPPVEYDFTVDGVKSRYSAMISGEFVFADFTPGTHTFSTRMDWTFGRNRPDPVIVSLVAGKTIYLKVEYVSVTTLFQVDEIEAQKVLKDMRHAYSKPLPYDKQR